jgi:hypothetical protein
VFVKHHLGHLCKYFGLELKELKIVELDSFQKKLIYNIELGQNLDI